MRCVNPDRFWESARPSMVQDAEDWVEQVVELLGPAQVARRRSWVQVNMLRAGPREVRRHSGV